MEDGGGVMFWEKEKLTCIASIQPSLSGSLMPGKTGGCSKKQDAVSMTKEATQVDSLFPMMSTKRCTLSSCTSSDITATLENESVWSRFHSLGTEMILTTQGRRMFPCCRFRLSGLDPAKKYLLIMDIVPLDSFTHKWNGKAWEPSAVGEPEVLGRMCVHPESPALGKQWMESPVSFYKVKLTNNSMDQDGCLVLRPMHHYQPRLHIVPADSGSDEPISLDSHDVKMFTFSKTEFYAVTSYQNPQITQLKIDCNPFAMAFREDSQSIRLLQDKLRLCSPGGPRSHSTALSLNRATSEQMNTLKNAASPCTKDYSVKCPYPESLSTKGGRGILTKIRNASRCVKTVGLCEEDVVNSRGKEVVKQHPTEPALDENAALLLVESSQTAFIGPSKTTDGPVSSASTTESLKFASEDTARSRTISAHGQSPTGFGPAQLPQSQENSSQVTKHNIQPPFMRMPYRRGRKARAKGRWSAVRCSQAPPPVVARNDVSLQPDLEDVEGMLFVSFAEKNMKHVDTSLHPQSQAQNQLVNHEIEDVSLSLEERLLMLESTLLLHLKQQKHRQVIHPLLQEVGMKLGLLDPLVSIDLQYLGVRLPFPSPVYSSLDKVNLTSLTSSCDGAGSFMSRTGKTNDPTKIKGWRDKFQTKTVQSVPEGLRSSSAFCSDMLDEYLRNEAQQITDRVAVFSKSSTLPVSYQLPSKSSSYVVTLDSLLKNRSTLPNQTLPTHSFRGSLGNTVPLFSTGPQHKMLEIKQKPGNHEHSFQSQPHVTALVQVTGSTRRPSEPVKKRKRGRPPLRRNSSGRFNSQSSAGRTAMTSAKTRIQSMLQSLEEEAFFHGKVRTHITNQRATFALNSLLTSQRSVRRTKFNMSRYNKEVCPEDFCRLGCICDSLHREIRGPVHCRRVECMFDCNCFKHKVFLVRSPRMTDIRQGRTKALMAFHPEKEPRPPPALSVTTLWQRRSGEHDPEALFVPEPAMSLKPAPRVRTYVPRPTPQIREEDKDPVYLYFESMMTCARVRKYNSNPPPQVHMLPSKREMQAAKKINHSFEGSVSSTSSNSADASELPEAESFALKPGEPEPTKLVKILSECNWEPHRNFVLGALFRRMSANHLTEPFDLGMYRVQPLNTTLKRGERCSTVCISRAEEVKVTEDLQPAGKTTKPSVLKTNEMQTKKDSAELNARSKRGFMKKTLLKTPAKRPLKLFPFPHTASAGYLKADKKKLGGSGLGLIKVNGKTYNQAKLIMGQMGALHPANRFAAFLTGRLGPQPREQPKVAADVPSSAKAPAEPNTLMKVTSISKQTPLSSDVVRPPSAAAPKTTESDATSLSDLAKVVEHSTSENTLAAPSNDPDKPPVVTDGSKFLVVPVVSPGCVAASSAEILPPGQPVVLHPVPGLPGSKFFCHYNGQMIQLVPVTPGPGNSSKSCPHSEGTTQISQKAADTGLLKDTTPVQNCLKASLSTVPSPKPLFSISPKIPPMSVMSSINVVNGTPAFNTQPSFPAKMGSVSFRICPPFGESKCTGSKQGAKSSDSWNSASSTLILPGGFTLIKLPVGMHSPVPPTIPADATAHSSLAAELPQNDNCMEKPISQSCSPDPEQECQASGSCTSPLKLGTEADDLNHGSNLLSSGMITDDESVGSNNAAVHDEYDWVPETAERTIKSNDSCEFRDLDDWPPEGAERVLWIDESDSASEEEKEDVNKQVKNSNTPDVKQASAEANDSKPTGATNVGSSACDESSLENKLSCAQEISLSSEADEQKCIEISLTSDHQETVHSEPFINANGSKHASNIQVTFDSSTISIKEELSNEPEQSLPISPPDMSQQVLVQQNGSPVLIKIEPCDKPVQNDVVDDVSKHLFPIVNKVESSSDQTQQTNALSNHLNQNPESQSGVFIKVESYNDQPHTGMLLYSSDSNITPDQMATVVSMHSVVSDGLVLENDSQILSNKEQHNNNTVQTELLVSTSPNNINSMQHLEESEDDVDVDGDAPCPLLEGQTPATNDLHTAHLPNVTSRKTDPKMVFLHTVHKSSIGSDVLPLEFGKQSNQHAQISGTAKRVHGEEIPEPQEHTIKNWNTRPFVKAAQALRGDEEVHGGSSTESCLEDLSDSSESDSDEENSSEEDDDDSNSSEEDNSSHTETASDSGTTEDSADVFSEDSDYVDIESFDEYQEKMIINKMKNTAPHNTDTRKTSQCREQLSKRARFDTMKILPARVLAKRLSHTEKERARRVELQHAFILLKRALNVEEQIKMCKHDILIQARLMIRALEDRSQTLEEKKRAMLQKNSAFLRRIAELTETSNNTAVMNSPREKLEIQNLAPTLSQINHHHLDAEGNPLPPHLGQRGATDYIQKPCKESGKTATITTDDESATCLPSPVSTGVERVSSATTVLKPTSVHNGKYLSTRLKPSDSMSKPNVKMASLPPVLGRAANGLFPLPKIVLQSIGKIDAVVKLTRADKTPLRSSSQAANSARLARDDAFEKQDTGTETGDSSRVCSGMQRASLSEDSNAEESNSHLPHSENAVQKNSVPEQGKGANASESVVKEKKKRSKRDVVIEDALSNPDALGPRQLRNRSLAVSKMATRSTPTKLRRRII